MDSFLNEKKKESAGINYGLIIGVVVGLALITEVRYAPPVWLHLLLWLPLTMILVLALMRPLKAMLIALQYKHRRHDFGEHA